MKNIILSILAVLTIFVPKAHALDFQYILGGIDAPGWAYYYPQLNEATAYYTCNGHNYTASIGTGDTVGTIYINPSDCGSNSQFYLTSIWMKNYGDRTPTGQNFLFKMSYIISFHNYYDETSNVPNRNMSSWMIENFAQQGTATLISGVEMQNEYGVQEVRITPLGNGDARVYESGGGVQYRSGAQSYLVEYFGYTWNHGDGSASRNDLFIGNPNSINTPLIVAQTPGYLSGYSFSIPVTISKPVVRLYQLSNLAQFDSAQITNAVNELKQQDSQNSAAQIAAAQTIAAQQEAAAQQRQEELMDDNTQDGQRDFQNYVNNYQDQPDPTLSSLITAPLRMAQALTTGQCTPLSLPIPIINTNVTLPCARALMQQKFPAVLQLWDITVCGLLSYHIGCHLFNTLKRLRNPKDSYYYLFDF